MVRRKRRWVVIECAVAVILIAAVVWYAYRPKPLYRVTILPPLDGGHMVARALNDHGQVAGFSSQVGSARLFLWDRGHGMQDLGQVAGNCEDINNHGQIVGSVRDPNGVEQAFLWDPNGGMRLLGTLGGTASRAHAINDRGWIVGAYEMGKDDRHAFLWDQAHGMRPLGSPGSSLYLAWALNDADQAVVFEKGGSFLVGLDDQGVVQTCDRLPMRGLVEINNTGHVVGLNETEPGRYGVGLWQTNSALRAITRAAFDTDVMGINDAGQVLFSQIRDKPVRLLGKTLWTPPQECFLWDPHRGEIPLNRYVSLGRGETFWVADLNNHGCILGVIQPDKQGPSRVVLLEPIPERWSK